MRPEVLVDRATTPCTPTAGAQPKPVLVTGLHGVGKTALLGELDRVAREQGWSAVDSEVSSTTPFAPTMADLARRALLRVSPRARWGERARWAAGAGRRGQVLRRAPVPIPRGRGAPAPCRHHRTLGVQGVQRCQEVLVVGEVPARRPEAPTPRRS